MEVIEGWLRLKLWVYGKGELLKPIKYWALNATHKIPSHDPTDMTSSFTRSNKQEIINDNNIRTLIKIYFICGNT